MIKVLRRTSKEGHERERKKERKRRGIRGEEEVNEEG